MALRLRVTEWVDPTRWRWLLEDAGSQSATNNAS